MPRGKENEIKVARGKLAGALQEQVPISNSDESETSNPPDNEPPQNQRVCVRLIKRENLTTPKSSKKQKTPEPASSDAFVIKLFDRSLDLCKFDDKTSLYPICRAWMLNTPRSKNIKCFRNRRTPTPEKRDGHEDLIEKLETGLIQDVASLPKPKDVEMAPFPESTKAEVFDFDLNFKLMHKNDLMDEHKLRWKQVRSKWVKHVEDYNKLKWELSFQVINALYKK